MSFFDEDFFSEIQTVFYDKQRDIQLDIKREDKIHPYISGNKFRKLKYNIKQAINTKHDTILTYGGAFSNHISATATAAKLCGLKSIGVIRGEELYNKINDNPTLSYAQKQGMKLHFISRKDYAEKDSTAEIKKLEKQFGDFYRIPEGGTNALAVKGCEEILKETDQQYDFIACCVGTGGTLAGIINSSFKHQKIYGFSALKNHAHEDIKTWTNKTNWQIFEDKTFGGYAKTNEDLVKFINQFYRQTAIKLDPIYTGKLFYNVFDLIQNNHFPKHSKILAIHTGGLQGVEGFNNRQKTKNKACIKFEL
jgi:1-aminocyclopropane-1-carboxylate deaminase